MGRQWDSNSDSEIGRLRDKNSHMSEIQGLFCLFERNLGTRLESDNLYIFVCGYRFFHSTFSCFLVVQAKEKAQKNRNRVAQDKEKLQHQQRQEVSNLTLPLSSLSPSYLQQKGFYLVGRGARGDINFKQIVILFCFLSEYLW